MKKKYLSAILLTTLLFVLAGCNGGGGSSGGNTPPAPPPNNKPANIVPVTGMPADPTNCNNDYTQCQPATGQLTTQLSGKVVEDGPLTIPVTVTAYDTNQDGSNGEVLGTSLTDAQGNFTMTLSHTERYYMRLTASNVRYRSAVDNTIETNPTLDLVTPYVTTNLNYFVITPVTSIASHSFAWQLANPEAAKPKFGQIPSKMLSYVWGNTRGFGMVGDEDTILSNNKTMPVLLQYLGLVPGSAQDYLGSYQDALWSFEWFGVVLDLPQQDVVDALSRYADDGNFLWPAKDGFGNPVNVGTWVGTIFDRMKTQDIQSLFDAKGVGGPLRNVLGSSILLDYYSIGACNDPAKRPEFFAKFPSQTTFFNQDPSLWRGACDARVKEWNDFRSRIQTNNRSKYMQYQAF